MAKKKDLEWLMNPDNIVLASFFLAFLYYILPLNTDAKVKGHRSVVCLTLHMCINYCDVIKKLLGRCKDCQYSIVAMNNRGSKLI